MKACKKCGARAVAASVLRTSAELRAQAIDERVSLDHAQLLSLASDLAMDVNRLLAILADSK